MRTKEDSCYAGLSVCCKAYMYMLKSYQKCRYIDCGVVITKIYIYWTHDLFTAVSLLEALTFEIHFVVLKIRVVSI